METDGERRGRGYPRAFQRWGIDVVRDGYTLVPTRLIDINLYLTAKSKLRASEMMLVLIILSRWWEPERMPALSKSYIASRLGVSTRQVQRDIRRLEEKGVLARVASDEKSGGSTYFDIAPLLRMIRRIVSDREEMKGRPFQLFLDFDEFRYRKGLMRSVEIYPDDDIPFE